MMHSIDTFRQTQRFFHITVFSLTTLVAASPFGCPPAPATTAGSGKEYSSTDPNDFPVTSTQGSRSTTTTDDSGSHMTISITNAYGTQVSVSFASNAGAPAPVGNSSATVIPNASPTQYMFPSGWAGRIYVGPNTNPMGSKIEGSFIDPPDIDVSYVDGYSVPITYSSDDVAVSGCNIDLFRQPGITCGNQVDGPICLNSAQNVASGPAPPFFAACAGAAHTYPNNNNANAGDLGSNLISCCIGTSCKTPSKQLPKQKILTIRRSIQIRDTKVYRAKGGRLSRSGFQSARSHQHHHHHRLRHLKSVSENIEQS